MGWVTSDALLINTARCQRSSANFQQQRPCPIYLKAFCIWILCTLTSTAHPHDCVNGSKESLYMYVYSMCMPYAKRTQQQGGNRHVKAPPLIKSPPKVIRPLGVSKNIAHSSDIWNLKALQITCSFSFFLPYLEQPNPPPHPDFITCSTKLWHSKDHHHHHPDLGKKHVYHNQ